MKKFLILFFIISIFSCSKKSTTQSIDEDPAAVDDSRISFRANGISIFYAGKFNETTYQGVGLKKTPGSNPSFYNIIAALNAEDYLSMSFANSKPLSTGDIDDNGGVTDVAYHRGTILHEFDGTNFFIDITSFRGNILNGSFGGILTDQDGSTIEITEGKLFNVPVIK